MDWLDMPIFCIIMTFRVTIVRCVMPDDARCMAMPAADAKQETGHRAERFDKGNLREAGRHQRPMTAASGLPREAEWLGADSSDFNCGAEMTRGRAEKRCRLCVSLLLLLLLLAACAQNPPTSDVVADRRRSRLFRST
ncbi:hypothetical protein EZV77_19490 [Burkholderia thailandensis]|nr:hypothetical protein [Burkholderia thailandensis]PJO69386.1 hypothetical protein CWD92_27300 [Burkholderia thailandensis]TBW60241.1 hypothetical protein EZV77_19490 [Burkholderia thailandensis]